MGVVIGQVGLGPWGRNLLRCFGDQVKIVCDLDEEALAWARGQRAGLETTDNILSILMDPMVNAVVVATPAETHYRLAMQALQHGKHVFVEKPMALTVQEGRRLAEVADDAGLVLMVGHLLRYHPAFVALQALVADGRLGRLEYVYSHRLNLGRVRAKESVLWSFAPHDVSMILALAGMMPLRVGCRGAAYLRPDIPDVTVTTLDFGEVKGHIFVSWLHPYKEQRLTVIGSEGMAVFSDARIGARLMLYPYQVTAGPKPVAGEPLVVPYTGGEPLQVEADHFIHCVESHQRPRTDGIEGVRVLRVLEAAERSLEGGDRTLKGQDTADVLLGRPRELRAARAAEVVEGDQAGAETKGWFAHPSAIVESDHIGTGTKIWHWTHVMPGAMIGKNVMIGQGCFVGRNVQIGDGCRIQNGVNLFEGVVLQRRVFVGPGATFTNVRRPVAWRSQRDEFEPIVVRVGATIGANATIRCGVIIGAGALVGAGAVVTHDVLPGDVVIGVPAREMAAEPLGEGNG